MQANSKGGIFLIKLITFVVFYHPQIKVREETFKLVVRRLTLTFLFLFITKIAKGKKVTFTQIIFILYKAYFGVFSFYFNADNTKVVVYVKVVYIVRFNKTKLIITIGTLAFMPPYICVLRIRSIGGAPLLKMRLEIRRGPFFLFYTHAYARKVRFLWRMKQENACTQNMILPWGSRDITSCNPTNQGKKEKERARARKYVCLSCFCWHTLEEKNKIVKKLAQKYTHMPSVEMVWITNKKQIGVTTWVCYLKVDKVGGNMVPPSFPPFLGTYRPKYTLQRTCTYRTYTALPKLIQIITTLHFPTYLLGALGEGYVNTVMASVVVLKIEHMHKNKCHTEYSPA